MTENIDNLEQENKSSGKGLSILSLLIAIASLGSSYFVYQQNEVLKNENLKLITTQNEKIANTNSQFAKFDDFVSKHENKIKSNLAQIESLVNKNNNLEQQILKIDDVNLAINNALENYARGDLPKVDLSNEIAAMTEIKNENSKLVEVIKNSGNLFAENAQKLDAYFNSRQDEVKDLFFQNLKNAEVKLQEGIDKLTSAVKNQSNPAPVINALMMAEIAAQNMNFNATIHYLSEAESAFTSYHLDNSAAKDLYPEINNLKNYYQNLAQQISPAEALNQIILQINSWEFKTVNSEKIVTESEDAGYLNFAKKLFEKTSSVRVISHEDRLLSWINKHENMKHIIKQNLRLDLAYLRHALQIGDLKIYDENVDAIIADIKNYFPATDEINNAINTLESLKNKALPEAKIRNLIANIENQFK